MENHFSKTNSHSPGRLKRAYELVSFLFTGKGLLVLRTALEKRLKRWRQPADQDALYSKWIKAKTNQDLLKKDYEDNIGKLTIKPKISIVMPVGSYDLQLLTATISSVNSQTYPDWELCIAIGNINDLQFKEISDIGKYADPRIKTINTKSNRLPRIVHEAHLLATGDYVAFMEQGDLLTPDCLFEFIKYVNTHPEYQLVYADNDIVEKDGKFSNPVFKPDWSPHSILSRNYIGYPIFIKENLLATVINTPMKDRRESSYYYIILRATGILKSAEIPYFYPQKENIGHIPTILYHRYIDNFKATHLSTADELSDAMKRRLSHADIYEIPGILDSHVVVHHLKKGKVSIIIPTRDHVSLLKTAIDSILKKTDYSDYEIIVLNNNSTTPEFFQLVKDYTEKHPSIFRCIDANFPFNYSRLMNLGASVANGKYLLMLNNDVEVINNSWMGHMVSYAQLNNTGAVGVKLLYPDNTIQHAGIVLGINGDAGHVFAHEPKNTKGYFGCVQTVTNYSAVTGACMMCSKELYDQVGGMDETLEVEYNDIDLCLKFLQKGYYNVYLPHVVLYHHESVSRGHPLKSKRAYEQHEKDLAVFKSRWQPFIDNDPFYNPNLSLDDTDFRLRNAD